MILQEILSLISDFKRAYIMSYKSCYYYWQLLFSLVFILSHAERFLPDLTSQYHSLFTTKFIFMLKVF